MHTAQPLWLLVGSLLVDHLLPLYGCTDLPHHPHLLKLLFQGKLATGYATDLSDEFLGLRRSKHVAFGIKLCARVTTCITQGLS